MRSLTALKRSRFSSARSWNSIFDCQSRPLLAPDHTAPLEQLAQRGEAGLAGTSRFFSCFLTGDQPATVSAVRLTASSRIDTLEQSLVSEKSALALTLKPSPSAAAAPVTVRLWRDGDRSCW